MSFVGTEKLAKHIRPPCDSSHRAADPKVYTAPLGFV